jgi:hypothetical protein
VRFKLAAPVEEPSRPKGIGLTSLLLSAFALVAFVNALLQASGGTLAGLLDSEHFPSVFSHSALLAVELFSIWSYWKGHDGARVLILVASFLIASDEVSTIFEHDGNLVVVMSHPVLFFRFALVVFLLYWLNTRSVRAWFKNTPLTAADLIGSRLSGKLCTAVVNNEPDSNRGWRLEFEHEAELILNCPWRIVLDDNLAFVNNTFANSSATEIPFDEEQPRRLLQNLRVKAVRVTPRTSDLFVTFEMGIELQTWSTDPQLQQWAFSDPVLTVTADSVGLTSHTIAAPVPTEDSAAND